MALIKDLKMVNSPEQLKKMGLRPLTALDVEMASIPIKDNGEFLFDAGDLYILQGPLHDLNIKMYASKDPQEKINILSKMCMLALKSGTPMKVVLEWGDYNMARMGFQRKKS